MTPEQFNRFFDKAVKSLEVGKTYWSEQNPNGFTVLEVYSDDEYSRRMGLDVRLSNAVWFDIEYMRDDDEYNERTFSMQDMNIPEKNGYNHWLIFDDLETFKEYHEANPWAILTEKGSISSLFYYDDIEEDV